MKVKYNRVSTILQTGNRFKADTDHYDMTLLDKVSGSVSFMDRNEAKKLVQYVEEGKITELVTEIVGVQIIIPAVDRRVDQVPCGCVDNNNYDQPGTVIHHKILSAHKKCLKTIIVAKI